MAPRRTKFVTLKVSSEELSKFPELTTHVQVKPKPRAKQNKVHSTKLKPAVNSPETLSREQSLKPGSSGEVQDGNNANASATNLSNLNNNNGNNANSNLPNTVGGIVSNASKLSSNVRVGVSGLVMNTSIVRELDKSGRKTSKWAKFETDSITGTEPQQNSISLTAAEGSANGDSVTSEHKKEGSNVHIKTTTASGTPKSKSRSLEKKVPEVEELDKNHGVISMRDFRGFKEHELKDKEDVIIEEARKRGRKVVRSFSGYLMLWPSWHKIEEGNLEKKVQGTSESKQGTQKKKESKTASPKNSPSKSNGGLELTPSVNDLKDGTNAEAGFGVDSGSASDAKVSSTPVPTPIKLEI